MNRWKIRTRNYLFNLIIISSLLLTTLPTNILLSDILMNIKSNSINPLSNLTESEKGYSVPKLTKDSIACFSEKDNLTGDSSSKYDAFSTFAVGKQSDIGGGDIEIYDSFDLTNITAASTQNQMGTDYPTDKSTTIYIPTPTDYIAQELLFNISDITAKNDWRLREALKPVTFDTDFEILSTSGYLSYAMAFWIEEEYAALDTIRIYHGYNSNPSGIAYIVNKSITSNEPDNNLVISSNLALKQQNGWVEYNFSSDSIILQSGQIYYFVMNVTSDGGSSRWVWYTNWDNTYNPFNDGGDVGKVYYVPVATNNWNEDGTKDMPIQIRVKTMERSGESFVTKKFINPSDILLNYSTSVDNTLLNEPTEIKWFKGNSTGDYKHTFVTNNSVSFKLIFIANYTCSLNPISGELSYSVDNRSIVSWNITYSTAKIIVSSSFLIRNHSIVISGIPSDFNGNRICWNDSTTPEYTDLDNNVNVTLDGNPDNKYVNGSSTMVVNSSTLTENTTWHIWFDTLNYFLDFNLSRGGVDLPFPYKVNVTDTLGINIHVPTSGGNTSYWIEYFDGTPVHNRTNFTSDDFTDIWTINDNVSQTTNVNGTYNLQAFWINSDKTKVGTITRNLDVYINTTLSIKSTDTIEVIIPETTAITILANYTSNHNSTVNNPSYIRNAKIWCNTSWPDAAKQNVTMFQPMDTYYSASLDTSGQNAGDIETITITTQLPWFINWTTTIKVLFVQNTSLSANVTTVIIEWRENITIEFDYNETGGDRLTTATITLVDTNEYFTYSNAMYSFQLNSSSFPGTGLYTDLVIKANSSGYLTREWYFNLSITPGITNVLGKIDTNPVLNDSTIINRLFSESLADSVTLNLQYYSTRTTDPLDTNSPIIGSNIPYLSPIKDINDLSWNITFNPDKTGNFKINITFGLLNYNSSTFIFLFNVQKAATSVFTSLESPINVYFTQSLEFSLLLNNTDYNELVKNINPIINNTAVVFVNNDSYYYFFRFNSNDLNLGLHIIKITFTHFNFESSNILLTFNVIEMPTLAILTEDTYLTDNGTIQIEQNLDITIGRYQTIHGKNITQLDEVNLWLNGSIVPITEFSLISSQVPFTIEFHTIGLHYGFYNLTIQIHSIGYQAQSKQMNITLTGISTEITIEIEPGKNIQQGEEVIFSTKLSYVTVPTSGIGTGVTQSVPLEGIEIYYYIRITYKNGTIRTFQSTIKTDINGQAVYIFNGKFTKDANGFNNITIQSAPGLSGLPSSYTMSSSELESYKILPPPIDIFEIIATVLTGVIILLVCTIFLTIAVRTVYKRAKKKKQLISRHDIAIEQSFEDIKSIRLIIARHESGLQFYSEKTIAEIQTDTDALSGMSAALSTFMEEISDSMATNPAKHKKNQIEVMSREGLHMLIWHGMYASLIIISEIKLPDYFQERLTGLGNELEKKFEDDLKDFYSTDQIPSSMVKKMVRKYIPLHHFSAFVLNEGVLTLKSINLSKRERKMLKLIKNIRFEKEGVSYYFSEQIISYLSRYIKRSEAIEWLEKAIELNLLIEASQEDLISIHSR